MNSREQGKASKSRHRTKDTLTKNPWIKRLVQGKLDKRNLALVAADQRGQSTGRKKKKKNGRKDIQPHLEKLEKGRS